MDISVAGRVLAAFPEKLKPEQRVPDNLSYLGHLCAEDPYCSIIKLPNISAPLNQLTACIAELRAKGYDVPIYPTEPTTEEDHDIRKRYGKVMGSAVNPVLREGNSDRRVAPPVKAYAQRNPHRMGMWSRACRTHVAHMESGDFYANEISKLIPQATTARIELHGTDGTITILNSKVKLEDNEIADSTFMSIQELQDFYEAEINDAKESEILLSLHLKATMMKVSDPIMFGHCIRIYYKAAFDKHGETLEKIGASPNGGLTSIFDVVNAKLPANEAKAIIADFEACYEEQPWLAMVNSDKGITNLHAPNDIIIDASMPVVIRDSGKMWNKMGEMEDTKCIIPDRCYATIYQEVISYVKTRGQFDVSTMGSVANVGLMAQKAEEYGSHDKTFELKQSGSVKVIDNATDEVLLEHLSVSKGDIWRMCQTKDVAIRDWVKLAVDRARATGSRTIFWLDKKRAHDKVLMQRVRHYFEIDHDLSGLDISILRPVDAIRISMELATDGKDTISVTGNVLRDYLTDLFPILELGTSAKMLSIVPLIKGGGLYETGAGGSAPKHVEQFIKEGHLRWDSLGEYLALAVCFERLADIAGNPKAKILGECLNKAVGRILTNRKSPSRSVNQIDNRATNYYVAMYWVDFLRQEDPSYEDFFHQMSTNRATIVDEFKHSQGSPVDLGGYYLFDAEKTNKAMNPSKTLNQILDSFGPKL